MGVECNQGTFGGLRVVRGDDKPRELKDFKDGYYCTEFLTIGN